LADSGLVCERQTTPPHPEAEGQALSFVLQ
jgi:hypothetical protein